VAYGEVKDDTVVTVKGIEYKIGEFITGKKNYILSGE